MYKPELEKRLVDFSASTIELSRSMVHDTAGTHLKDQVIRSCTSAALNFGEAESAESRKDFLHKLKVVLKELRETFICLQIIQNARLNKSEEKIDALLKENNELISIFIKSVITTQEKAN